MHTTRARRAFLAISSSGARGCVQREQLHRRAPSPASPPASKRRPSVAPSVAPSAEAPVTLTYLVDDSQATQDTAKALTDAYTAKHPNVTITIETRPGGTDGDNIVKTRLATGEMDDIFWYNSGSLLQALNPTETLVDISASRSSRTSQDVVPADRVAGQRGLRRPERDGHGRRHPVQQEGLRSTSASRFRRRGPSSRPTTRSSRPPASRRSARPTADTWTSQLFVLADYYNVSQAVPTSPPITRRTRPSTPTRPRRRRASASPGRHDKGWYQKDYRRPSSTRG